MLESWKKFLTYLRSKRKSKNSPFVILTVVLIIIIPSVFAVVYGYFSDDITLIDPNTVKISLYDQNNSLLFSKEANQSHLSDSETLEALYMMHSEKVESGHSPSELPSPNFSFTVKGDGIDERYNCYFFENATSSYIKDKYDKIYSVPVAAYKSFLLSEYSEVIYSNATPPSLTTGNGEVVSPSSGEWFYRRIDKKTAIAQNLIFSSTAQTYKIGGAIDLLFDHTPNECHVTVYDTVGTPIYDGSPEDLPFLTVEKGVVLTAHIDAKWNETDENEFHGSLSYDFKIIVGDRSEFSVSATDIYPGQFIVISGTNIDDVSKIIFSSKARRDTSEIKDDAFNKLFSFVPTFIKDGDIAKAILPIPTGMSEYVFSFSLSYGAAQQRFTINIHDTPKTSTLNVSIHPQNALNATSSAAQRGFSELTANISNSPQDMILWRNEFVSLSDLGFTSGYAYNDTVIFDDEGNSFISKGNEYLAPSSEGKAVPALNNGRVIKTGYCDALGNYVIIDHGMGLRTYYCFLSDMDVVEGQTVTLGDSVGKCGRNGILSSDGVLILCSVYDILIDPDFIIGKKI